MKRSNKGGKMKVCITGIILLVYVRTACLCPNLCVCKWRNGKQTVECNNKGFLAVPAGMDPGTQVLEFSGNNLESLVDEQFMKSDLINLQRVYLARCNLKIINDRAFKGLTNLVELDLSENELETVPTPIFLDCPSLMRLTLNRNPIKVLHRGAFNHLSFLNTLELRNCEIRKVEEDAFQGLHGLEWLHLDGNKLRTLQGSRILPESLKGVELQGNLWECDCNMRDLYAWLLKFSIPQSMEPTCSGPERLSGRPIKLIQSSELACLPDVSPTTFYLEIGEGKNISLLCHVRAIPEAHVSWWFRGQIIQNDTLIAPGVHIIYYVEEGTEDKISELFIYNTNPEDNGTFACTAENAAGITQSNFTIRIIVKEEPIMIIVAFPFKDFLLAVVLGAAALLLVVAIMIAVLIIKCRRSRRRQQKRDKTKEVALHYQQNSAKCVLRENVEQLPDPLKVNSTGVVVGIGSDRHDEMMLYSVQQSEEQLGSLSPAATANQVRSPTSLRHYQPEQNPDLINDAESVGRRHEGDGEDEHARGETTGGEQINSLMCQTFQQFPMTCIRGVREGTLNYGVWDPTTCLLDNEGYPIDYGLPKVQCGTIASETALTQERYYRTLPYNRTNKRQSAANPLSRYSREAEFLCRSTQPTSYEQYDYDVRYTADGYPARLADPQLPVATTFTTPSPPEDYKTDPIAPNSLPCCSNPKIQWPTCVPANIHMINQDPQYNQPKFANVTRRCVGAQTDTESNTNQKVPEDLPPGKTENTISAGNESLNEILTESPDEGYGGEPSVV